MLSTELQDHESIVSLFDSVCFSHGDQDAIVLPDTAVCYLELQEYSRDLAAQLWWRFRPTSYILVDARCHVPAEAVALLACIRIGIPFVPVSAEEQHTGGRLNVLVQELVNSSSDGLEGICAVVCCQDDRDPILGVFAKASIHRILFLDPLGNLRQRLDVPSELPELPFNDNLYVLFTSGTTSNQPKAVVGSHTSTLQRLKWFRDTFEPSPRIGRRTRLTFVDSITELFGGLLFPPSVLVALDPAELRSEGVGAFMKQHQVTHMTLLPSQLSSQVLVLPDVSSLERVVVSGEPCPASLIKQFRKRLPNATLINLYGQTETTGDVLCAVLTNMSESQCVVDNVVAVGKPILSEVQVSLASDDELVIQGNLSNGYLDSAEPFDSFPTGDIGFCRDGIWYVKGRKDDRCKVLGTWTCPTEIEAALYQVFGTEYTFVAVIVKNQIYSLVDGKAGASFFSRERMKEAGIPWNLIPLRVFAREIPRKSTGAGKVDRLQAKQLVECLVGDGQIANPTEHTPTVESITAQVLKLTVTQMDLSRSFIELGGDSGSAITLLYQLRQTKLCVEGVSATDILQTDSLEELRLLVLGRNCLETPSKRARTQLTRAVFAPPSSRTIHSACHMSVDFAACVDSSPLVHGEAIYAACQCGVVQRFGLDGVVTAHHQFVGWMIQAALIISGSSLVVSACTPDSKRGLIAALSLDLDALRWSHHLTEGGIKVPPCLWKDKVWFCAGNTVRCCSLSDGTLSQSTLELPWSTSSCPLVVGNTLVFASTDPDSTGLMTISDAEMAVCSFPFDEIGPVYKALVASGATAAEESMLLCDHYGSIHLFAILNGRTVQLLKSRHVANKPLTSACVASNGNIVCGSYRGNVHCLDGSTLETRWTYVASAAIYATPVMLDSTVFLTTTAGDVIRLNMVDGTEIWMTRVAAEIWSNPVALSGRIIFGARDSRVHIVQFR